VRTPAPLFLGLVVAAAAMSAQQPMPSPRPGVPPVTRDGPDAQQKTGTARMSGRVTAADTGRPLRRALVRAMAPETPEPRSVSTDVDGHWELRGLPAARYTLSVSKGGYVTLAYGQLRPFEAGKGIELADGQVMEKLDVSLPRAGVITGTVVDELGDPISGARVSAMRNRYAGGQRRLVPMGPPAVTDDIGQYRLHSLSPGEYYVSASLMGMLMLGQSDDRVGYAPTFYPGTAVQGEAQRVSVSVGEEAQQINFAMALTRVATISGTAVSASGKPITRGMLTLITSGPGAAPMGFSGGSMLRPDGTFKFSNVAPGEYRLMVQHVPDPEGLAGFGGSGSGSLSTAEFASLPITVTGEDVVGLALVTSPAATAKGQIHFEGGSKPTTPAAGMNIAAVPFEMVPMPGGAGRVRDDWTFEVSGLADRRRFRVSNLPVGWFLKSVIYNGVDVTDSGIEFNEGHGITGVDIVLTQRATELSGTVQDSSSRPVTDYAVVAFSDDSSKWGFQSRFVRMIRPNQDGRFSLKGLPPDRYLVVALEYIEPGEEGDPEQLEHWRPGATSVTLADGEAGSVTLRLTR
jgi:hypothetical protein